jgi:hypothetical protein
LKVGRLNVGLRAGGLMVGGVTASGQYLEVLSGGRRRRDAVVARPSWGGAGGR